MSRQAEKIEQYSLGQFRASLLGHHECRVPVRPLRVCMTDALLVLAVGGRCPYHRSRQFAGGTERRGARVDAPRQAGGDLLENPAVAVRSLNEAKEK
jgi:hypothetical protein